MQIVQEATNLPPCPCQGLIKLLLHLSQRVIKTKLRDSRNLFHEQVRVCTHRGRGPGEVLPLGRGLHRVVEPHEQSESRSVPVTTKRQTWQH